MVASALAVAQPLFSLLGGNAAFFVAHGAGAGHLYALAFGLVLLVPAPLFLLRWLLRGRVGRAFQGLALSLVAALGLLPLLGRLEGEAASPWPLLGLALAGGALCAWAYRQFAPVRSFLTVLSPAVLLFPLLFLYGSQVARLLGRGGGGVADLRLAARPPILLVVFDELALPTLLDPDGGINAARFPSFAKLAASSHWFRNASTVAQSTEHAVPAILTGRYPRGGQVPNHVDHSESLFQLLGGGYRMRALEPVTSLCPAELCPEPPERRRSWRWKAAGILRDLRVIYGHVVLPAALAAELPPIDQGWKSFDTEKRPDWAEDRAWLVRREVEALARAEEGSFHFLHFLLPHAPWEYLPSGATYGGGRGNANTFGVTPGGYWIGNEWLVRQAHQRYLLQLSYADRVLGELMEALGRAGRFDEALIVVTADHGATFRPDRHRRRISPDTVEDIVPVPLFVKLPAQRQGVVSDRNVELVDILPTMAEVLGLGPLPWPVDGVSAFAPEPAREGKTLYTTPARDRGRERLPADLFGRVRAAAGRTHELFGSTVEETYHLGPLPDLVGRAPAAAGLGAADRAPGAVVPAELWEAVDPASGFVPARVVGRSDAPHESQPRCLAVAVGGVVRAVTFTFERLERFWMYTAMVPESSLRAGANRIEVYDVTDRVGAGYLGLRPVPEIFGEGFEAGSLESWHASEARP